MRNWSFGPYAGTWEQAIAAATSKGPEVYFVLEVEGTGYRSGESHIIGPGFNTVGFASIPGEDIECSGLGLGSQWRVRRCARVEGRYVRVWE